MTGGIWDLCKAELQKSLSPGTYGLWIAPLNVAFAGNTLTVRCPTRVIEVYFNKMLLPAVADAASRVAGAPVKVITECPKRQKRAAAAAGVTAAPSPAVSPLRGSAPRTDTTVSPEPDVSADAGSGGDYGEIHFGDEGIPEETPYQDGAPADSGEDGVPIMRISVNPNQTFANYISGPSNREAIYAANIVIDSITNGVYNGSVNINPLYIYGGSGLGKSHLLNAMANKLRAQVPDIRLAIVDARVFVDTLIEAFRVVQTNPGKLQALKDYFRKLDILMFDDIQFLSGKKQCQEEFFNIFNQLFGDHHQIVVTSDVYSKKVSLPDRLKTRLSQGATYEIKPPEFETRQQIFLSKAEQAHLRLTKDVAFFVAQNIQSNVRELEAAVNKLSVYGASKREKCREEGRPVKQQLDVNDAKTALHDILQNLASSITVESIIKVVADYYHLKIEDFRSKRQYRKVARPRQIAMTLARELTRTSFPQIGECFGGRDHSTVVHACKNIQTLCEKDQTVRTDYENIKAAILSC